jgi:tetratricopeptide (TPR) repeat protein
VALGIWLAQQGRQAEALSQMLTARALAPRDGYVAFSLGKLYLSSGDYRRALPHLEAAAALEPRQAEIFLTLGLAYFNTDQGPEARRAFETAARLGPQLPETHLGLAMAYSDRRTAGRALKEIDTYIKTGRNPALGQILLSRSYALLDDAPHAIEAARSAVASDPSNVMAWQTLGLALTAAGAAGQSEAENAFREAVRRAPNLADAHIGLARSWLAQKRYAEAAGEFQIALRLDPAAGYVEYELGRALQGAGKGADARAHFAAAGQYMAYKRQVVAARQAIQARPGDAALYLALARLYYTHGAIDWARPPAEKALQIQPGMPEARRFLQQLDESANGV